jgi:hypothetical protein
VTIMISARREKALAAFAAQGFGEPFDHQN